MSAKTEDPGAAPGQYAPPLTSPLVTAAAPAERDRAASRAFYKGLGVEAMEQLKILCKDLQVDAAVIDSLRSESISEQLPAIYDHICRLAMNPDQSVNPAETREKVLAVGGVVYECALRIARGENFAKTMEVPRLNNLAVAMLPIMNPALLSTRDGSVLNTQMAADALLGEVEKFAGELLTAHLAWRRLDDNYQTSCAELADAIRVQRFSGRSPERVTIDEKRRIEAEVLRTPHIYELAVACRAFGQELIDRLELKMLAVSAVLFREPVAVKDELEYQGKLVVRDRHPSDIRRSHHTRMADAADSLRSHSNCTDDAAIARGEAVRRVMLFLKHDEPRSGVREFNLENDPGLHFIYRLTECFSILAPVCSDPGPAERACRALCGEEITDDLRKITRYKLDGIIN